MKPDASENRVSSVLRVCHLTSAHPRSDIRIFRKECLSLVRMGFEVCLVVADGLGDEVRDGIKIVDAGASNGRVRRIFGATWRVFGKAKSLNCDVYHLHDPELIPVGVALSRMGRRVIFDAHEDVTKQLLSKPYLNPLLLRTISWMYGIIEYIGVKFFDTIITATPSIRDKFTTMHPRVYVVNNYPLLDELIEEHLTVGAVREAAVCYIGGICEIRGIFQLVESLGLVKRPVKLLLGGIFSDSEDEVKSESGWEYVNFLGQIDRNRVKHVLSRVSAGLVTFLPVPNHVEAQPNKMFEYMSAGVPVIGSNFPLWREVIEGNQCGICVDPMDPGAIAAAIDMLVGNPDLAAEMGANGRRAVIQRYNWAIEEDVLREIYGCSESV